MSENTFYINMSDTSPEAMAREMAEMLVQLTEDQAEWLDATMKKVLTPPEYDRIIKTYEKDPQYAANIIGKKYRLQIVNGADIGSLTLLSWGRPVAQFYPAIQFDDGQRVYAVKPHPSDPGESDGLSADRSSSLG